MIKETIFTNMEDIEQLPTESVQQDIEITPQEVLDYFSNNQETNTKEEPSTNKGKARVINEEGDVELTISRETWKKAGLDDLEQKQYEEVTDPSSTPPIPTIADELLTNKYTEELLHSKLTSSVQDKMLYDLANVTIDDKEKELYLRSVLENIPLKLYVTVGKNRKIGFNCISKTIALQNLITKLAAIYIDEKDENDTSKYKHSAFESGMYLLKLNAMFCLKEEGDEHGPQKSSLFTPIPENLPFDEQKKIVDQNLEIIDNLSFAKWNAIINIMRIFEHKEVLLGAELVSGDF